MEGLTKVLSTFQFKCCYTRVQADMETAQMALRGICGCLRWYCCVCCRQDTEKRPLLTNASRSNSPYPPEPQKDTEIQEMEYHFMVASEEESDWETPLSEGEEETAGGRKVAHSFMVRGATGRASWELVPGYPSKSTGDDTR